MPRMRLIDDLAARRLYYPRPLPTLPDILVIDVPTRFAGAGLALDHYYPIVLETLAEMQEMEAFLCTDRGGPVVPDLFDRRPSGLRVRDIVFARRAGLALPAAMFLAGILYRDGATGWRRLCTWGVHDRSVRERERTRGRRADPARHAGRTPSPSRPFCRRYYRKCLIGGQPTFHDAWPLRLPNVHRLVSGCRSISCTSSRSRTGMGRCVRP